MKFDRIDIRLAITVQMLCINGYIKEPSPPKSLDIFLLCPTVDPQLRVNARSGKHNIVPVSAHKHQIRLRVRIGLDRVQKDLGEYFYWDKVGFVTGRLMDFVTGLLVEVGGCPVDSRLMGSGRIGVRPIGVRPIGVRIHGE